MSKKRKPWQDQFDVASLILKDEPGEIVWATDDYVAFRYREPDVRIVFYPHRTSAGHHHIRIRDEGSKDKARFLALAGRLHAGGHFAMKHAGLPKCHPGLEFGWAVQQALGRTWME